MDEKLLKQNGDDDSFDAEDDLFDYGTEENLIQSDNYF